MKTNVVPFDRALRSGGGLLLLATPLLELPTFPYNLLGIVLMASGLVGFCPAYALGRAILPKRGGGSKRRDSTRGFGPAAARHAETSH